MCLERADKILVFFVLNQWFLQRRETEASLISNLFYLFIRKIEKVILLSSISPCKFNVDITHHRNHL